MPTKEEGDKIYNQAYDAGRNGNLFTDFVESIAKGLPNITKEGERHDEIYHAGVVKGSEDGWHYGSEKTPEAEQPIPPVEDIQETSDSLPSEKSIDGHSNVSDDGYDSDSSTTNASSFGPAVASVMLALVVLGAIIIWSNSNKVATVSPSLGVQPPLPPAAPAERRLPPPPALPSTPSVPTPDIQGPVNRVFAAEMIFVGGKKVQLCGIQDWGHTAAQFEAHSRVMAHFLAQRSEAVKCYRKSGDTYRCFVGDDDIGRVAVRQGIATELPNAATQCE
jgi:hypothetical protein